MVSKLNMLIHFGPGSFQKSISDRALLYRCLISSSWKYPGCSFLLSLAESHRSLTALLINSLAILRETGMHATNALNSSAHRAPLRGCMVPMSGRANERIIFPIGENRELPAHQGVDGAPLLILRFLSSDVVPIRSLHEYIYDSSCCI